MAFVVDASVGLKWVLQEPDSPQAERLARRTAMRAHSDPTWPTSCCLWPPGPATLKSDSAGGEASAATALPMVSGTGRYFSQVAGCPIFPWRSSHWEARDIRKELEHRRLRRHRTNACYRFHTAEPET